MGFALKHHGETMPGGKNKLTENRWLDFIPFVRYHTQRRAGGKAR